MATYAHSLTSTLARQWDSGMDYPSAQLSGIVGDEAHRRSGGYHMSIEDQPSIYNYSVTRPDDKAPPGTWPRNLAAAIDMTMNTADMVKCYKRVRLVYDDRTDPRRGYINAFNGWDGTGDAIRLDFYANHVGYSSPDHKWHCHLEIKRKYVASQKANDAIASILRGESKGSYVARTTGTTQPQPTTEEDIDSMSSETELKALNDFLMTGKRYGRDATYGGGQYIGVLLSLLQDLVENQQKMNELLGQLLNKE